MGRFFAFILALGLAGAAQAQPVDDTSFLPAGAILFVNQERMLAESELGKLILTMEASERAVLTAESERIASELEAAEQQLTDERPTAEPEAFRTKAEAFNLRVEQVRAERLAADQAQTQRNEDRRRAFYGVAGQILGEILVQNRASAIMDRRSVLLFNTGLDITDLAIVQLDAAFAANPDMLPTNP